MRFGLQPVTRRVWTRRGVEVVLPVVPRHQWGHTCRALEICGAGAGFLHTDGVSLEASRCFLEQAGRSAPEAMHIVHLGWRGVPPIRGRCRTARQRAGDHPAALQPGTQPGRKAAGCDQGSPLQPGPGRIWMYSWKPSTPCSPNTGRLQPGSVPSSATAGFGILLTLRTRTLEQRENINCIIPSRGNRRTLGMRRRGRKPKRALSRARLRPAPRLSLQSGYFCEMV